MKASDNKTVAEIVRKETYRSGGCSVIAYPVNNNGSIGGRARNPIPCTTIKDANGEAIANVIGSPVRDRSDAMRITNEICQSLNTNAILCDKLKVAEDALEKLQDRLVSSVHDGTIDPHEALEIAENALAAIHEEGCDPCNARDGEGSSLRIGWEGENEYCVVAKYRQDLQVELEDYDYHRVTGPLPLDIAKHWLDYHKRIRTKSEDPKILVREVSKWRLFDPVGEGSGK